MNLSCIVLISLACLVLSSYASPIQVVQAHPADSKTDITVSNNIVGRQAAAAGVPAVPVAVDDEDDDDDDEVEGIEDALDDDDGKYTILVIMKLKITFKIDTIIILFQILKMQT